MKTIRTQWEEFERDVIARDAGEDQRREMRNAFYGGAWVALCLASESAESVSEEEGVAKLEALHQECREFVAEVTASP